MFLSGVSFQGGAVCSARPSAPPMRLPPALLLTTLLALPLAGCAGSRTSDSSTTVAETLAPGLTLHLTTARFDASRYEVITDETGFVLGTADCDAWHGSDGGVPALVVTAGWVVRQGERLDLDTSCMGSYDPGPESRDEPIGTFQAQPLDEPGTWRIIGRFSDGAGTAEVAWTVGPTETTRDRLVSGPDLSGR